MSRMDGSGGGSTSSSNNNNITRWNPTKDQVNILEGLYGQGMRTPTADQIQRITSRLRAYGHIEGKNVFYWFQNHKARQRQKEKELQQQPQQKSSCLSFSYMNRRFLYFHNSRATSPGFIYHTAPSPSSTNVVFRPYYVAQNETAGDITEFLLPSGSNRRLKVTDDDNDCKDKLKLSLTTATPFETEFIANNSKSTLDLFPVYPSGIDDEQGPRMISLGEEAYCSGYMENYGGGDLPFFDFLSVNGCCGHD